MTAVIVGAGLAGFKTSEALRTAGYSDRIILCGSEVHLPYDRPPLSKQVLADHTIDTTLAPRSFFEDHGIELRLGVPAVSVDTGRRQVEFADASHLDYDELVVASGLQPRRMPGADDLEGVHYLRTRDDAQELHRAASRAERALIVGGGFIGCEVAASLRSRGLRVTLVEPTYTLLASVLGPEVGRHIDRLHVAEGVEVECGVEVVSLDSFGGRVVGAQLSNGKAVNADIVVVGIGAVPATSWLSGSGIGVGNGVLADARGRTSAESVWAVGDSAAWHDGVDHRRLEHWSNVATQAKIVAESIVGNDAAVSDQPHYFWSDQYNLKLQCLGSPRQSDTVHVVAGQGHKFVAYYERGGQLSAVVGLGMPAKVMTMRGALKQGTPISALTVLS